jgi:hypothetical protein
MPERVVGRIEVPDHLGLRLTGHNFVVVGRAQEIAAE